MALSHGVKLFSILTQITALCTVLVLRSWRAAGIARHADVRSSIFVLILITFQLSRYQDQVLAEQNYRANQPEKKHCYFLNVTIIKLFIGLLICQFSIKFLFPNKPIIDFEICSIIRHLCRFESQ